MSLTIKDSQIKLESFGNSQKRLRNLDFHSLNDFVWDYNLLSSNQITGTNFRKNVSEISEGSSTQINQFSLRKVRITLFCQENALSQRIFQIKPTFSLLFIFQKCHIFLCFSQLAFNHLQFKRSQSENNSNSNWKNFLKENSFNLMTLSLPTLFQTLNL